MEPSSEAKIDPFAIWPSTAAGKAVAFRILVCASMARLRRILSLRASWTYWKLKAKGFMNPRSLQAALALVLLVATVARRYTNAKAKFWRNLMRDAVTYEEWSQAARMAEPETPMADENRLYDRRLVESKLRELLRRRNDGNPRDVMLCLRAILVRNLGNMCNPELHKGRLQVPKLINEYIDEVSAQVRTVCRWDSEELAVEEKMAFVQETRHAFGRTALLLSGGASLGAFHVGVVQTLVENGLLPRVVAGASVGSIMCSVVATRTWPELRSFFEDSLDHLMFFDRLGGVFAIARRVLAVGAVHEIRQLQRVLRELTGNLTFQEAYDMTGRVLGISVCSPRRHEPPRCLNYLTSPHVVIWSAVTASCAFPGLFQAQELMAKDRNGELVPYHTPFRGGSEEESAAAGVGIRQWRDGSLESDLPMAQLMELFNVNHFIVSQANPHIAPLLRLKELVRAYGGSFAAKLAHLAEMEVKHRCNQVLELGFPLGGIAKLFAQDWEGDVTVVMPATLAQFAKIIQNPSQVELRKAINQGRRCTWEKLSAIKANCGIELVLDECVSFLNRMHRLKKNAERAASQEMGNVVRFHGAKRIPSWVCISRENSWGSLDDERLIESTRHPSGPWGGPSGQTLRSSSNAHNESDSESESMDTNVSQIRAGGPLMRTASATKFVQSLDVNRELDMAWNRQEAHVHDSSEDPEGSTSYLNSYITGTPSRDMLCNNCNNRVKQNWDRNSEPIGIQTDLNGSDVDDSTCCCYETRSCSNQICGSASRIAVDEGNLLQPERSPTGIVINVVKREDIALANGDHDVENCQNGHAFRIDECSSQIGSTGRHIDEDDTATASDCSNIDRDTDIGVSHECSSSKWSDHDSFSAAERNVYSGGLAKQHPNQCLKVAVDPIDQATDASNVGGPSMLENFISTSQGENIDLVDKDVCSAQEKNVDCPTEE